MNMARRSLTAADITWEEQFLASAQEEAEVLAKLASALFETLTEANTVRQKEAEDRQDDYPIE
jgi:hypothetical protein